MFSLFIVVTTDAEDCVTESGIEADVVVKVFVFVLIIDVLVAGVEDDDDDVMIDAAAVVVVVIVEAADVDNGIINKRAQTYKLAPSVIFTCLW